MVEDYRAQTASRLGQIARMAIDVGEDRDKPCRYLRSLRLAICPRACIRLRFARLSGNWRSVRRNARPSAHA